MMKSELIRCVQCNVLAFLSPLDRSPEYHRVSGKWTIVERDDRKTFMENHQGHPIEKLKILEDTLISHQNYLDPVKTSYFEATNGKERIVVKRFRQSALDPLRYELVPGRLRLLPTGLRLDGIAIQRELERAVSETHLTRQEIIPFVQQLEYLVSRMKPGELTKVPFEGHNPSVWYYYLDERLLERAEQRVSRFLDSTDVQRMGGFVRQNLKEEPFLIMAKIDFHIENGRQAQNNSQS